MDRNRIQTYREMMLQRIREHHIRHCEGHDGPLFLISTAYPGYWLEHLHDPILWAKLFPEDKEIAASHLSLFLENQREDGKLPFCVLDNDLMSGMPGVTKAYTGLETCPPGLTVRYGQLQECVSVASLCLEVWHLLPEAPLAWYYDCCCKWDTWLCKNRMTRGEGLIETFCGFDTGHDNSTRFANMKYYYHLCKIPSDQPEGYPVDCPSAPLLSPDINAVFYGARIALSKMASLLGKDDEAAMWQQKADAVKKRLFEICYDPADEFFYDVDKNGQRIRVKSVSITNLFCEHLLDQPLADRIYERYLTNPQEFGTPFAFPGVSVSDPTFALTHSGNDWGYYSQGNVALRTLFWMEHYGYTDAMHEMMEIWLDAWCRPDILRFGQELHPLTGEPSASSEWYSATMLYLLHAMRMLYPELW